MALKSLLACFLRNPPSLPHLALYLIRTQGRKGSEAPPLKLKAKNFAPRFQGHLRRSPGRRRPKYARRRASCRAQPGLAESFTHGPCRAYTLKRKLDPAAHTPRPGKFYISGGSFRAPTAAQFTLGPGARAGDGAAMFGPGVRAGDGEAWGPGGPARALGPGPPGLFWGPGPWR